MSLFELLNVDNFYGESEEIEIAKGKYEYVSSWKQAVNKIKRRIEWLRK